MDESKIHELLLAWREDNKGHMLASDYIDAYEEDEVEVADEICHYKDKDRV